MRQISHNLLVPGAVSKHFRGVNSSSKEIRPFLSDDLDGLTRLLVEVGLPTAGLVDAAMVMVYRDETGKVRAGVALEVFNELGLLRSLAVDRQLRQQGRGRNLVREMMSWGQEHGVRVIYLLTDTAQPFFARLGFSTVDRSTVPDRLRASQEFEIAECRHAVFMRRDLSSAD